MYDALDKLNEVGLGAVRYSKKGVPHLVFNGKSICYFGKTNVYRVFEPYPSNTQTKKDFKTVARLIKYLQK